MISKWAGRIISTALSKAFDSTNHKGLIKKLYEAGAGNNVRKIIENYLSGISQGDVTQYKFNI